MLALDIEEPKDLNPNCEECALHSLAKTVCIAPDAYSRSTPGVGGLYVIGESPGRNEDQQGRAFIGASGRLIRSSIDKFWNGPVTYDNAVRCAPGGKKISETSVRRCRPYLAAVYKEVSPKRIICLGAHAVKSVVGASLPIFAVRKGVAWTSSGVPVFFVAHPAAALRNRFVMQWFIEDLEWACTVDIEQLPKPPLDGVAYLIETPEDAREAVFDLETAETTTIDLETFGRPKSRYQEILTIGCGPAGEDYAYVWELEHLRNTDIRQPLLDFLADERYSKGGQNFKFDLGQLQWWGAKVRGDLWCTRLWRRLGCADVSAKLEHMQALVGMAQAKEAVAAYVNKGNRLLRTNERSAFSGISSEAMAYARERVQKHGIEPKQFSYAAIPSDERAAYCARDVVSTGRLQILLRSHLDEQLWGLWKNVGSSLHHAIQQMEYVGIKPDVAAIRHLQQAAAQDIEDSQKVMLQYGDFNPNSAAQVGKILFEDLKLPVAKRTATGQYSCNAETLRGLSHPLVDALLLHRKATKLKSQYADGMLAVIEDDGRIHPDIKIDGTETGRPSCSSPNLMNIPRPETEKGKMCRDIFVAEDGYKLVELDYSQIELRVAAMLSKDPVMTRLYNTPGTDFHLETARMIAPIFGLAPEEITKAHPLRSQAKTVNFAVLYGDPPEGLAVKLGITVNHSKKLINAILGRFEGLKKWIAECLLFTRKYGYCNTWWNGQHARRRPLWKVADGDTESRNTAERSSWNTPIQGSAAEYTNASIGAIQKYVEDSFIDARPVLTVYDSILIEAHESVVDEIIAEAVRIMQGWPSGDVPLKADVKVGYAWGSLESS